MKIMPKSILDKQLKAIANAQRLMILDWLKDPTAHFRPQIDGDLVKDRPRPANDSAAPEIAGRCRVPDPEADQEMDILQAG